MVSRQAEVRLQTTGDNAFRQSREALMVIGAIVTAHEPEAGRLVGRIPMSLKSWGEEIDVRISGSDENVAVRVTSSSRLPTTLIDWGKNAENVARFVGWLTR